LLNHAQYALNYYRILYLFYFYRPQKVQEKLFSQHHIVNRPIYLSNEYNSLSGYEFIIDLVDELTRHAEELTIYSLVFYVYKIICEKY